MASHRKPPQHRRSGSRARALLTAVLAGAAASAGLDGVGHAAPKPTPEQVREEVDKLYREAEAATEKYNGAKEKTEAAERRVDKLQDEAARRTEELNTAREALGSAAAAQYRSGNGLGPAMQLALSSDPDRFLRDAGLAERAGALQATEIASVARQIRELDEVRQEARTELEELEVQQERAQRHKKTVTGKLAEARRLLSRLTAEERARLAAESGGGSAEAPPARPGGTGGAKSSSGKISAPNSRASAAVSYAQRKLGSPYVWGATGPNAFDCSGLVQAAYRSAGVSLPRTTYAQIGAGQRVSRSQLRPGDLVFFYPGVTHVGMYIGDGKMIHAPNPSAPVRVAPVDEMPFAGATRVV
ncbi:C40 family peptidase [Streptomyces abyssomicinicus]|uniref:C40 family peptidase n=1 Tax=Streptomyces abyssomicinicus TaxID=574929 RepID=UPI001FE5499A|nr:C40 family peptidase [Streptomyces abyssomicinicus]